MNNLERFDEIFKLYSRDVYRLVYSYVINRQDAEDITQKVFLKLCLNNKKMSIPNIEIKKWLFRVAVNETKNFLKTPWRKIFKISTELENVKSGNESEQVLVEVFDKVSRKYRVSLYLFYYEGYSIKEIAQIIGKSEAAIKMILKRGKSELKMRMEGH